MPGKLRSDHRPSCPSVISRLISKPPGSKKPAMMYYERQRRDRNRDQPAVRFGGPGCAQKRGELERRRAGKGAPRGAL